MKPKIGVVGYFGWGNFGDELFIEAHKEFLSEKFKLEVVHDLYEAPYFSEEKLAELDNFDGFLIGGGDLINPSIVSPLYWREEYLKKPVFVYGIGVPQLNRKTSKALNYFNEFFAHKNIKATVLRDVESMRYFNGVINPRIEGVTFPDAVCAMSLPKAVRSGEKLLGISIRQHRSVIGGYEHVRRAADEAKRLGYKVRVIVMGSGIVGRADHEISKEFAKDNEEIIYSEDLNDICVAIGECHQLISMKFHGMVVAAMYGIPSLQLAATQKNKNFMRYIQRKDMASSYQSETIFQQIPRYPVPIHSLITGKLKRDARAGYSYLLERMSDEFS